MSDSFELRSDTYTHDPASNQASYDAWAENYDADVHAWNYQSPVVTARILQAYIKPDEAIFDAGCGTGLTGLAFNRAGFQTIDGVDLSPQSVARAASRGVYRNVVQKDMSQLPFAQTTDSYGATTCIGVLTYIPKPQPVIQEFCRLTKPGGFVIITQRTDIYSQLGFGRQLREIEASGSCRVRLTSDPQPYLPGHADYSDTIRVVLHWDKVVVRAETTKV